MVGFSVSGAFTDRFAVLHPDQVLGRSVGRAGGAG
jgi:hypothetical protein